MTKVGASQSGATVITETTSPEILASQSGVTVVTEWPSPQIHASQSGVTIPVCLVLYPATGISGITNVNDIDLAWTNIQENAFVSIWHSTDGISYSELVELDGSETTYTHVAPDKLLGHYYIFYAIDGLCESEGSAVVFVAFGKIYAIDVLME